MRMVGRVHVLVEDQDILGLTCHPFFINLVVSRFRDHATGLFPRCSRFFVIRLIKLSE